MRDRDLIICEEKHGTSYWPAHSIEEWAESALAILTERDKDGYWYHDPDDDGLGTSEWADKRRDEYAKAEALTKDQIEALPEDARKSVLALRTRSKKESDYDQKYRKWYKAMRLVVDGQDTGTMTVGRGKWEREEPRAWLLLQDRSDHEYERVELESFRKPREA